MPEAPVETKALPLALRPTPEDDVRRERLSRMKRVATLMLLAAAALYLVSRFLEQQHAWAGFVRAFAEAAMVGGIADWFAVTALFRHPMGIPIPHTAIVPSRKDRIGTALGNFVQRNFMTREVVASKLAAMRLGERAAGWLAVPENSRRLAGAAASALAAGASAMRDEDVQALVDRSVVSRLRKMQAAPLAAKAFELLTADGRHQELLDDALRLAAKFLQENESVIRDRVRQESPWWVPGAVEDRLGDKVVSGVEKTLTAVAADPNHPLRKRYDEALDRFVQNLQNDPATIARIEKIKSDVLAHPGVAEFSREVWADGRSRLAAYAERLANSVESEPDQVEQWLAGLGNKVLEDPLLAARINAWAVELVTYSVEQARDEVAALISATVAAWDADATSRKIELQIGRDLQFIRINGTLVGGLVGLALYSFGLLF